MHWFNQWKKYVGWDNWDSSHFGDPTCHPGKIDNSALLTGRWSEKLICIQLSIMVCNADVNRIFSFFSNRKYQGIEGTLDRRHRFYSSPRTSMAYSCSVIWSFSWRRGYFSQGNDNISLSSFEPFLFIN